MRPPAPLQAGLDERYKNRYIIAAAVSLAAMMQVIDSSIVNVAIPSMMGNLGVSLDEISLVSTSYIVASVIVIPMTGWLASFFGRKQYFAGSILLFTIASFLCGTADTLGTLVFWRIIQGIGGGALMATSQAILYESFPREETGTAMAFFGLGIMVGPTLGPTLGGWITDNYTWPWIFYINIPFGILACAMIVAYVHDNTEDVPTRTIDLPGIALLILSVGMLQFVLERGDQYDWFESRLIVGMTAATIVATALLVWRELTAEAPVIDFSILKNTQFTAGTILGIVVGAGLMGSVFILPVYFQQILHLTALQTGVLILPGALATAFAMLFVGRLSRVVDNRLLIVVGSFLFAGSMWQLSKMTAQSGAGDFFWPLLYRGFGLGLVFVPMTNLTLSDVNRRDLGQASGLYNFFRQMGGSLSIAVMASSLVRITIQNKAVLSTHLSGYDVATRTRLDALVHRMVAQGTDAATAKQQALTILDRILTQQAYVLAFSHIYLVSGLILIASLPLLLLFKTGRPGASPHAAPAE
ncbi:MAG: DHA2 family efflux MFS transporter permease subunit [Rhodothermales bacterium]